jgi:hypothetical protein
MPDREKRLTEEGKTALLISDAQKWGKPPVKMADINQEEGILTKILRDSDDLLTNMGELGQHKFFRCHFLSVDHNSKPVFSLVMFAGCEILETLLLFKKIGFVRFEGFFFQLEDFPA